MHFILIFPIQGQNIAKLAKLGKFITTELKTILKFINQVKNYKFYEILILVFKFELLQ